MLYFCKSLLNIALIHNCYLHISQKYYIFAAENKIIADMTLNNIDYQNIANMIEVGSGTIEYTKGHEILFIDYIYTEDGYDEDDYLYGTGAYVVTTRFLSVGAVDCFNEDGEATKADFCESQLLTMVA